jgi:glucose/arabinose dehydrogenase
MFRIYKLQVKKAAMLLAVPLLFTFAGLAIAQAELLLKPVEESNKSIRLEAVASGLTAPNWGTFAPGDDGRLFVSDQAGILWAIDLASGSKAVFLDVSSRLVSLGVFGQGTFDERGLLAVAFHPDYANNGLLYTYTSEPLSGAADFSTMPAGTFANHQSVISEWQVPNPTDKASVVNPASNRVILRIDEPQFNHDGGGMGFGHDWMLYVSLGDGGGADDHDGQPFIGGRPLIGHSTGNGQDPSNPLGAILRIDPMGSNSSNGQYDIPADNPFVGQAGYLDEIYAYGFRNPFRFSFDMETGDLYVGDVGQNDVEEVDVVVSGGNYGWNAKEGSFCFDINGPGPGFAFEADPCPNEPTGVIDPVAEYNTADDLVQNQDGRAVIGGFVYRGGEIPGLVGRYVFGDFSLFTDSGVNNDGRLFFLNKKNIVRHNQIKSSKVFEFQLEGQDRLGLSLLGFGQDAQGELYVLANGTGVPFGNTGVVLKITSGD